MFVTESLNSHFKIFDPTADHIEEIKAEISNLKYNKKHEIKRTFDSSFINKIKQQNKILESNINFYLQQRQFEVARYHYDQLTILAEKLKN
jgi:6-pyruvoyl-tetrahydropterin synthase